jgi:hypothetical protein
MNSVHWQKLTRLTIGVLVLLTMVSAVFSINSYWSSTHRKPSDSLLSPANIADATAGKHAEFLEDPGVIKIESVFEECGESTLNADDNVLAVVLQGSMSLPSYVTNATVVLNGWKLKYLKNNHHVSVINAHIRDIELTGSTLNWNATGYIVDKNADDPYEFCYHYTVIGWNASEIDAVVAHKFTSTFYESRQETTALNFQASYIKNDEFIGKDTVATLPAGITLGFAEQSGCSWLRIPPSCYFSESVDHHILQLAYNLGRGEPYLEFGKNFGAFSISTDFPALPSDASFVGSGYVSWESDYIIKDNNRRRDVWFAESVSVLAGNDIEVIKPPFTILPEEDFDGGCITGGFATVRTDEFVVENVPYEYAVPLLTGWDIGVGCDDKDVREVGIWLHDIAYEKEPDAPVGTLRYSVSSVFRKKTDTHYRRQNVSVLGIRPISDRGTPLTRKADLIPVPDETREFCVLNGSGQLVVTVNNQGNFASPASTTKVEFTSGSSVSSEMTTPALEINESTPVIFDIPAGCFVSDCKFEITVDSANQINETNENNDMASGQCIG